MTWIDFRLYSLLQESVLWPHVVVCVFTSAFDVTVDRVESLMHITRHGCTVKVCTVTHFRKLSSSMGSCFFIICSTECAFDSNCDIQIYYTPAYYKHFCTIVNISVYIILLIGVGVGGGAGVRSTTRLWAGANVYFRPPPAFRAWLERYHNAKC